MSLQLFMFIKHICFALPLFFLTYKLLLAYGAASQSPLCKKTWTLFALLTVHDFCWMGMVGYKMGYRLWISDIPQPTYLLLARLILLIWPLVILFQTFMYELFFDPRLQPQKRHYLFSAITIGLVCYFGYCLFIKEPLASDPWFTLDPFCSLLARAFIVILRISMLILGIKRLLIDTKISLIVKHQTKLILAFLFVPSILTQPIWIVQSYGYLPKNNIVVELCILFIALTVLVSHYYAFFALFRLRLFNASPAVRELFPKSVARPLSQVSYQIRQATTLQELGVLTKSFFERAFHFEQSDVALYIRPTHHKRNSEAARAVHTLPEVEALITHKDMASAFDDKLRQKRLILHTEAAYDTLYNLNTEAQEACTFMEQIQAEIFLPIYGKKQLIGYIVITRNTRAGKLISETEVDSMLTYVDHISHAIEQMQQLDPELIEQESLNHQQQALQLFQEREHCYEGMRTLMQAQTSEAVSMIFYKYRSLRVAGAEGKKLLGLPESTISLENTLYDQPIKQLMREFKHYQKERSIILKDPLGNPLRFSVMRDTKQSGTIVLVSRPTISTLFNFPSFASVRDNADWGYALFLQTTASGKQVEKLLPSTWGPFFDFKIAFLRAIFSRRPLFLQGAQTDARHLATVAHQICAHTNFQELSITTPEQRREIASQLFGDPALETEGYLATLRLSGTLYIEHIENLSLETQELLAHFFATGLFASFYSKQRTASDALIVCSSNADLALLVEQGLFSSALYEQLTKNTVMIPSLANAPHAQLRELFAAISEQIAREAEDTTDVLTSLEIDELLTGPVPETICDLRSFVAGNMGNNRHKAAPLPLPEEASNLDTLLEQARQLGRAVLKNKKFLAVLTTILKSYAQIAEVLGVDRTTVYRACKKYRIGQFAGEEFPHLEPPNVL